MVGHARTQKGKKVRQGREQKATVFDLARALHEGRMSRDELNTSCGMDRRRVSALLSILRGAGLVLEKERGVSESTLEWLSREERGMEGEADELRVFAEADEEGRERGRTVQWDFLQSFVVSAVGSLTQAVHDVRGVKNWMLLEEDRLKREVAEGVIGKFVGRKEGVVWEGGMGSVEWGVLGLEGERGREGVGGSGVGVLGAEGGFVGKAAEERVRRDLLEMMGMQEGVKESVRMAEREEEDVLEGVCGKMGKSGVGVRAHGRVGEMAGQKASEVFGSAPTLSFVPFEVGRLPCPFSLLPHLLTAHHSASMVVTGFSDLGEGVRLVEESREMERGEGGVWNFGSSGVGGGDGKDEERREADQIASLRLHHHIPLQRVPDPSVFPSSQPRSLSSAVAPTPKTGVVGERRKGLGVGGGWEWVNVVTPKRRREDGKGRGGHVRQHLAMAGPIAGEGGESWGKRKEKEKEVVGSGRKCSVAVLDWKESDVPTAISPKETAEGKKTIEKEWKVERSWMDLFGPEE
ncbi:hypothetical protein BLNAU_4080 [Blattamonas nauphoetae]|uniref:Uncharacterized protein n=1 Tax=Blattamonas nauphoetae TaxID=2049346 RepID=A0ABQ9YB42_9EUKA|nr:hypothetical protein BLNAU_4080 [Blattamonas nauphoetae]